MENRQADVLVLFGITGDLARKLVLPALYRLTERGELTVPVIGVALTDLDTDGLRRPRRRLRAQGVRRRRRVDDAVLKRMIEHTALVAGDYADPSVFTRLAERDRAGRVRRALPRRAARRSSARWPTGSPQRGWPRAHG